MKKAFKVRIHGKVQGVWFRASTQQKARELGVSGFVKNEPDGTVYAEVEGEKEKVQKLIDWCHEGSSRAEVRKVETEEIDPRGFTDFEIRR